jgi:hypothetical protein
MSPLVHLSIQCTIKVLLALGNWIKEAIEDMLITKHSSASAVVLSRIGMGVIPNILDVLHLAVYMII